MDNFSLARLSLLYTKTDSVVIVGLCSCIAELFPFFNELYLNLWSLYWHNPFLKIFKCLWNNNAGILSLYIYSDTTLENFLIRLLRFSFSNCLTFFCPKDLLMSIVSSYNYIRYASSGSPKGFCQSSQLKVADFSYNFLVGSIPKCLEYLPRYFMYSISILLHVYFSLPLPFLPIVPNIYFPM